LRLLLPEEFFLKFPLSLFWVLLKDQKMMKKFLHLLGFPNTLFRERSFGIFLL
jgi:hypothetical protein